MINAAANNQTPMENTSLPTQPQMSTQTPQRREVKKGLPTKALFGGMLVLFLFVALAVGTYLTLFTDFDLRQQAWFGEEQIEDQVRQTIKDEGKFQKFIQREANLTVGDVVVSTSDLEKRFEIYHAMTPENVNNILLWKHIGTQVVHDAALQNLAIQEGYLAATETTFNPQKVNEAREYFETRGTNHISGEMITLWFYNTNEPEMGVEAARALQKERIDSLRQRLVNGEITMKEAGEEIAANADIEAIDPAWVGNAYHKFEYVDPGQEVFNDPKLNTTIWNSPVGEYTDVLVGQDFTPTEAYDAYFSIVLINEKQTNKHADSVTEVMQQVEIE